MCPLGADDLHAEERLTSCEIWLTAVLAGLVHGKSKHAAFSSSSSSTKPCMRCMHWGCCNDSAFNVSLICHALLSHHTYPITCLCCVENISVSCVRSIHHVMLQVTNERQLAAS